MHTTPKQQQGKAQTIKKKQNQQNTPQQHHWSGEANTAKSIENFPCFFFKKKREPIKIDQNAAVTGSLGNPVPIPM